MKKVSLVTLMILLSALSAAAQLRSNYSFDNFSSGGIRVISPSKPAAKPTIKAPVSKKTSAKQTQQTLVKQVTIKKPVQRTSSVQDSLALADNTLPARHQQ